MNVLVTGASRGIGYELVKYFCSVGSKNVFVVSRDNKRLEKLKKECAAINRDTLIHILPFSLEKKESIQQIAKNIFVTVKHLDIVVNNAGFLINKKFEKINAEELEKVYNVNVFAPFLLIQSLMKIMGKKSKTHIVNVGSMGGVQGQSKFPGLSAYTSSKMALAGLSECLAEEFKDRNISVNCLALGAVNTEMLASAFPGYQAPLNSDEMATFIGDFSINGHKYFNGKILPVASTTP